jgi:cation diffusion facilitator CzcD-associated flavoprotein CzcO
LEGRGLRIGIQDALVVRAVLNHSTTVRRLIFADIPAHTYQATFEPNKDWSTFYAAAPEIHKYWKRVSDKYGCEKHIQFKRQVVGATWDAAACKWKLQVKNIDSGKILEDTCDVVVSASGALNEWKWPSIEGLHDFKGKLLHSACWDESYDYSVCCKLSM